MDNLKLQCTADSLEAATIQEELEGYSKLFCKFVTSGSRRSVDWDSIKKPPPESTVCYSSLEEPAKKDVKGMLARLVVIKLNGGLGTSMECKGPKSTTRVRGDQSFLDLTVQQMEHFNKECDSDVPLVFMNSFNTEVDTEKTIAKYAGFRTRIITFNQSRYPRIDKDTLMPIAMSPRTRDNINAWYPPGHGDFYQAFSNAGVLDEMIREGRTYCFISNIDNLGATVDHKILKMCLDQPNEFIMEVANKTRADVKG